MKLAQLATISLLFITLSSGFNHAVQARPSTYQHSCREMAIDGDQLLATCRRQNGRWRETSIVLRGIENDNGRLRVGDTNYRSSYQNSCRKILVDSDRLSATCRKRNGRWRDSSIRLDNLENRDGWLVYRENNRESSARSTDSSDFSR
jgi:CVNH domain